MSTRKSKRSARIRYEDRTSQTFRSTVLVEFEKDLIAWQKAHKEMIEHQVKDFNAALDKCGPQPKSKAGISYCNKKSKKWTPAPSSRPTRERKVKTSHKSPSKRKASSRKSSRKG